MNTFCDVQHQCKFTFKGNMMLQNSSDHFHNEQIKLATTKNNESQTENNGNNI